MTEPTCYFPLYHRFGFFFLILWSVSGLPQLSKNHGGESAPATIEIDWQQKHQTIVGFSGTMGWIYPPPEKRNEISRLLFDDLGCTVLRIRAMGGVQNDEYSAESKNDNADPQKINPPGFQFKRTEAANAATIKAARVSGVKLVIATPWSPPGWMKTNASRVGGSLHKKNYPEYAEHIVAYIRAMKKGLVELWRR